MPKLQILDHPLIQHKLSLIRDEQTGSKEFRELVEEVSMLMAYEVTRDFPLQEIEVKTPVAVAKTKVLVGRKVGLVPIKAEATIQQLLCCFLVRFGDQ